MRRILLPFLVGSVLVLTGCSGRPSLHDTVDQCRKVHTEWVSPIDAREGGNSVAFDPFTLGEKTLDVDPECVLAAINAPSDLMNNLEKSTGGTEMTYQWDIYTAYYSVDDSLVVTLTVNQN